MRDAQTRECLRIEEDLLYSENANFAVCTIWATAYWVLGIPSALAAALTGLSATEVLLKDWTGTLGLTTTVLTALLTVLNPSQKAQTAHQGGVAFSGLRARVRRFRDLKLAFSEPSMQYFDVIEAFGIEKADLIKATPHTGGLPYWLARRSIEKTKTHVHEADK